MGVAMEIEVDEICDRFGGAGRADLTGAHQPPEALRHLDVRQMWRVEFFRASKETRFDARPERGVEEKLQ
jgi:hypothetical protein